jgi:hypothetical protein
MGALSYVVGHELERYFISVLRFYSVGISSILMWIWGHALVNLLRSYATRRKVAGSSPG